MCFGGAVDEKPSAIDGNLILHGGPMVSKLSLRCCRNDASIKVVAAYEYLTDNGSIAYDLQRRRANIRQL